MKLRSTVFKIQIALKFKEIRCLTRQKLKTDLGLIRRSRNLLNFCNQSNRKNSQGYLFKRSQPCIYLHIMNILTLEAEKSWFWRERFNSTWNSMETRSYHRRLCTKIPSSLVECNSSVVHLKRSPLRLFKDSRTLFSHRYCPVPTYKLNREILVVCRRSLCMAALEISRLLLETSECPSNFRVQMNEAKLACPLAPVLANLMKRTTKYTSGFPS